MAKVVRRWGPGKPRLDSFLQALGDDANTQVGFFETAKYPDGTPAAYVAVIQENGVEEKGIPPRSTFANTIVRDAPKWQDTTGKLAVRLMTGGSIFSFMEVMGAIAAAGVQQSLREINSPPLADSTIRARRRAMEHQDATEGGNIKVVKSEDDPLMRTEFLHDSVQFKTSDGKRSDND